MPHQDGLGLRIARAVGRVVAPGDRELFHVGPIDLRKIGVAGTGRPAAVRGPIVVGGEESGTGGENEQGSHGP